LTVFRKNDPVHRHTEECAMPRLPAGATIDDLIELMGGVVETAKACGKGKSTISMWKKAGTRIPQKNWEAILQRCRAKGITGVNADVLMRLRPAAEVEQAKEQQDDSPDAAT
jgi:hypothetical protein